MEFELKVFSESAGMQFLRREAPSIDAARAEAQAQGFAVLSSRALGAAPAEARNAGAGPFQRGAEFPLVLFSRELLALHRAGLPLLEALETLAEKEVVAARRRVIEGLCARLRTGQSLSRALADFPREFPQLYVASIGASEHSGAIGDALRRYIAYQEQVDAVRRKVAAALVYPSLLLAAGGLVVVFLMAYVVPRFSRIYSDRIMDLPWLTRLLLDWGRLIDAHGWAAAAVLACVLAAGWRLLSRRRLLPLLAGLAGRIPAIGEHLRLYQLTRLYRTLGMLLRGGMPISAALGLVPGLLDGELRQGLADASGQVREGQSLSQAFTRHGLATAVAARLLRVGERTGQMDEMMDNIASFHEEEIARRVDLVTRTIEPALMMVIGLTIGAIVILMYLPIFELAGSFAS